MSCRGSNGSAWIVRSNHVEKGSPVRSLLAPRINLDLVCGLRRKGGYETVERYSRAKAKTLAKLLRTTCYAGSDNHYNDQKHSIDSLLIWTPRAKESWIAASRPLLLGFPYLRGRFQRHRRNRNDDVRRQFLTFFKDNYTINRFATNYELWTSVKSRLIALRAAS
jgi:hypothetical protein